MSDDSADGPEALLATIGSDSRSKDKDPLLTFQSTASNDFDYTGKLITSNKKWLILLCVVVITLVIVSIILLVVLDPFSSSESTTFKYNKYLIVISLDGFRSEYFENPNISSPNIHQIAENGVHIKRLIPVFPSLTFPNHYTLATGLFPGDHGIVSNSFWDPILQKPFSMSTTDRIGEWYKGEPIWLTHRMEQNIDTVCDYKTATIFWVGSDQNCSGKGYPDYYLNYNYSYPFKKRIDNILQLLQNGEYKLIMSYFEQPDSNGHSYGPNSIQVKQSIEEVDTLIGYLINGIKDISIDLYEKTDIIITSDHGMTDIYNESIIHINDTGDFNLSDTNNFRIDLKTVGLFIRIVDGSVFTVEDVMDRLSNGIIYPLDLVQIFNKETIPFEYKNGFNNRIPDVFVTIPIGYQFKFDNINVTRQNWLNIKGNHGYNNTELDMSALFVAQGPSFKTNYTKDTIENIHLYELFCYLMDMEPSANNGSIMEIKDVLVNMTNVSSAYSML
eukprot:211139_1